MPIFGLSKPKVLYTDPKKRVQVLSVFVQLIKIAVKFPNVEVQNKYRTLIKTSFKKNKREKSSEKVA
ncbi:ISD11 [Acrasis kona]|uniref:ISD11 n=1 Tax=Acrasis kona TaxID=1008807 RepID=A0AAW2YR38_9EUKA